MAVQQYFVEKDYAELAKADERRRRMAKTTKTIIIQVEFQPEVTFPDATIDYGAHGVFIHNDEGDQSIFYPYNRIIKICERVLNE